MKISRIVICLIGTFVLVFMLGCNDFGLQLAKILPENDRSSIEKRQLSQSGDLKATDGSKIGGGNASMSASMTDDSSGQNGFVNSAIDGDYSQIMKNVDADMGMDMNTTDGSAMGLGMDSQMMQLDDLADGFEDGGLESELGSQSGMFVLPVLPSDEGGFGYMKNFGDGGAMGEPQMDNFGGQQSLGGFGNGVGGLEKPTNGRGPQKQMPSKGFGDNSSKILSSKNGIPNIRDRPTKSTGNEPFGVSNNPRKPQMGFNSPPTGNAPTSKSNRAVVKFSMPGNITNPVYDLVNTVAVSILLQNNTAMSFSSEVLQKRDLKSQGTVYWVVHSQPLGFSPFPIPREGGRVNGVVAKFTPTSGPFKAFIAVVEPNGQIKYLSSSVDIQWNP